MKKPENEALTSKVISLKDAEKKKEQQAMELIQETLATALEGEKDLILLTQSEEGLKIQTNMPNPCAFSLLHIAASAFLEEYHAETLH